MERPNGPGSQRSDLNPDPLLPACVADGYQVFAVADNGKVHATQDFAAFQVDDQPRPAAVPFAALA